MARSTAPTTEITIPGDAKQTGVRGKIERLFMEYHTKAQALRITMGILDEDDRRVALAGAPKKFLNAINHRNGHAPAPKIKKPKPPISGKRLMLFLLEHLDDTDRPPRYFVDKLAAAGSPINGDGRGINGPLAAVLAKKGLAKRSKAGAYRITAKGAKYAAVLRKGLEAKGAVAAGGYLPA